MRYLIAITLIGAAFLLGCMNIERAGADQATVRAEQKKDGALNERDEFRQTYELQPGARVEIEGINGPVTIETGDNQLAEVHIIRAAASRATLEDNQIIVEQTPTRLSLRGERKTKSVVSGIFRSITGGMREEIRLKLPRRIELSVIGVNGAVTVGEVSGPVALEGINGAVTLTGAAERLNVTGVNGKVVLALSKVEPNGTHLDGINGAVELNFAANANAEIVADGVNGGVTNNSPDITLRKEEDNPSAWRAQIGTGGPAISLEGVNGSIKLSRSGAASKSE
ncbi:MAG TPA: hypothetical protein VM870_06835 [Pyrinomonadaceae bacterium]|jgi:DUF4097 and DUF4098 domain-containing protein YvlB|nr:hypothetical protein [Pyrinomonadaceae bacterium]